MSGKKSFFVVYIPHDQEKKIEEWEIDIPQDKPEGEISCLIDRLKIHYAEASKSTEIGKEALEEQKASIRKKVAEMAPHGAPISEEMLSMLIGMNSVDAVPLLPPSIKTEWVGVNLFVDDQGKMKGLPMNLRASSLCYHVENPMQVLGDAFVARFIDDNVTDFKRMDFQIKDLHEGNSDWMDLAKSLALIKKEKTQKADPIKGKSLKKKNYCSNAGCAEEGTLRCGRCQLVFYCSKKCQKAHWKTHKPKCKKPSN